MFLVCRKVLYICIMYVYDLDMRVMWDPQKARLNHKKHGFASLMPRRCSLIPTHLQERMMKLGASNGSYPGGRIHLAGLLSLSTPIAVRQSG